MFDPHSPTSDQDRSDPWLNRVSALLAKAESTDFPDEAEALLAKAQELMARHAIDDAMLARAGRRASDTVDTRTILVEAPYATAKASLLGAVAQANGCRVVMGAAGDGRACIALGHVADLDSVESLFGALSLHAVRTMLAAPVPPGDTVRRFRHAFLLSFAARIGERLREARRSAERSAEAESADGAGVALVLADRASEVDRAFREAFPRVRTMRTSSSSAAGRVSGRRAADSAGLGHRAVGGSRALPGG
ncbi:MAG: DUF2786 domain-containing protein [Acidimicrobiales bacterium]|nr:DUF2786 domain-containing protein [Acidimicrobiales bacterium]